MTAIYSRAKKRWTWTRTKEPLLTMTKERLWMGLPIYSTTAFEHGTAMLVAEGIFKEDGTIDEDKVVILRNLLKEEK